MLAVFLRALVRSDSTPEGVAARFSPDLILYPWGYHYGSAISP